MKRKKGKGFANAVLELKASLCISTEKPMFREGASTFCAYNRSFFKSQEKHFNDLEKNK